MRTKVILGMAALAAGALSSMAQSNVYSLNVVGYVNTQFPANQLVLVSSPLDPGTNDLNSLIPTAPLSSAVSTWNVGLQDYDATVPSYNTKKATWVPNLLIAPGQGFFVTMTANFTNTFVGNVRQGALSTPITGSGALDLIGSQVPMGGSLTTNVLAGYPGTLSDAISTWNVSLQDFDATVASYNTKKGIWVPDDMGIKVADGFFLARQGAAVTYTRNFTVQ
jgi:hypothetical protein